MHVYHRNRSAVVTFQQHDDCHGHTPSYYPKDQCSGPRHCRYVRPGHLHPRPALSSPPPSAWNGPPDHQLKKIFRCAGRQVKLLLWRRLCFRREGAPQKGSKKVENLCRRRPWPNLCRSARLRPAAHEQGRAAPLRRRRRRRRGRRRRRRNGGRRNGRRLGLRTGRRRRWLRTDRLRGPRFGDGAATQLAIGRHAVV